MLHTSNLITTMLILSIGFGISQTCAEIVTVPDFSYFARGATPESEIVVGLYSDNNGYDYLPLTIDGDLPSDPYYKVGFSISGGSEFVGYAQNNSWVFDSGYQGFLEGYYYNGNSIEFEFWKKITGLYVVHDVNNDGIGTFDTETGILVIDADDTVYTTGDTLTSFNKIEIAGIEGNVDALPAWERTGFVLLPAINLVTVPEPATLIFLNAGIVVFTYIKKKIV